MLAPADSAEIRFRGVSLDDALRALSVLGVGECLVCGAVVEASTDGGVDCGACGSELDAPLEQGGGQLALA